MILKVTPVFDFLHTNYNPKKKQIFVLEGSSGSSKTHSIIQFLTYYSQIHQESKRVTCGRLKMTWTISSIWDDFVKYLNENNYKFKKNESKQ